MGYDSFTAGLSTIYICFVSMCLSGLIYGYSIGNLWEGLVFSGSIGNLCNCSFKVFGVIGLPRLVCLGGSGFLDRLDTITTDLQSLRGPSGSTNV